MPALSKSVINEKFKTAKVGFEQRWEKFSKNRKFVMFDSNFDDDLILKHFVKMHAVRNAVYFENLGEQPLRTNPGFERSQDILMQGFYKFPHLIAFEYNASDASYNSSNVTLKGHRFLALEGPQKPQHVDNFLALLINYDVKKLVRLTNAIENSIFKSENYWYGKVQTKNDQQYFTFIFEREESKLPYFIEYYSLDDWQDDMPLAPTVLLKLLQNVRKNYTLGDIIAVHCSAGVGRTGTFIAGLILLDEIDQQLKAGRNKSEVSFSIEELVYKLSLQRVYLVGKPEQYLSLHELAKLYIYTAEL